MPHPPITDFRNHRWLSNFWPAPVTLDGVTYPSVENAYQAAKTQDTTLRIPFQHYTSTEAKRNGRKLPIRPDWEQIKLPLMRALVAAKFAHPTLRAQLLATEDAFIAEGNYWRDTFWGIYNGTGTNHLGRILMEVRQTIREGGA